MIPVMMRFWMPHGGDVYDAPFMGFIVYGGGQPSSAYYAFLVDDPTFFFPDAVPGKTAEYRYVVVNNTISEEDSGSDTFTINEFDINDRWHIYTFNRSVASNYCNFQIEFQDSDGDPVAAIETSSTDYKITTKYGASLASLTNTATEVGWANPRGFLTFNSTTMIFTNSEAENYTNSFSFSCDAASIAKVYVNITNIGPLSQGYPYDVFGCFVNIGPA